MWSKLHVPWRGSRRTPSPTSARQRLDDPERTVSLPEGLSTIGGTRPGELRRIDAHQGPVSSVRFLPEGKHLVIGSNSGTVRLLKVEEGSEHASEVGKGFHSAGEISAAEVSKDGKWVILAGARGFTIWDATTHERMVESIEAHAEKITALDVSLDVSKIATGSRDGTMVIWCLETGRRIAGPLKQDRSVLSVRFSPAGDRLASAVSDYSIYVWSICNDGCLSATRVPTTDPACSLAWAGDGCHLFAGCHRGSILCFDVSGLAQVAAKWNGHPHFDSISTLCLSNNGKFIISASSSECSVKIWDVHTRSEITSLQHDSEVLDAEISFDDCHLVSGTKEGKIYIWNLRNLLPTSYFFHSLTACMIPSFHADSHPILTEIDNEAYVSWRKGKLVSTEDILSNEIERSSTPSHYHLANRALVRARLQQWDRALDDAQASLSITPSLVARLAKSIAQSGQNRHDAGIEALNHVLESCDQREKDFVDVIKVITLFDAGHRDGAISHVNNLAGRSPDIKQPCTFVEESDCLAKMYTLLAAEAMNNQQYIKAMSLFAQARDLCPSCQCPFLDTLSLVSGWVFDGLKLAIHRQSCEACYAAGCTQDLLDAIRKAENFFTAEIHVRSEQNAWFTDFKSRCAEMLESEGDEAMHGKNYDNAIAQYSAALAVTPIVLPATFFVKRSKARMASWLWEDSLKDAEEAIRLNPSSPWGYERKHAALHQLERYGEAIDALSRMISILDNSPDPEIRHLRGHYIDPSDTKKAILDVFRNSIHNSPFRLIDTINGQLCDAEKRRTIFTEDLMFEELISSMTTQLHQERIDMVTMTYFQYVMLSHRWEAEELELADVLGKSIYELDASPSATKLQQFCRLARDAKFRWAWSDTCCIDKDRDVEFEKSINSMFQWYRSSAATFVYLTGVPPRLIPGALKGSVWMRRGWTLQELLAPPVIRFYYEDWTPYLNDTSLNHKQSTIIMEELEDATSVTKRDLLAFHPGPENARVKLRLASTRETTVPVDMAYGLFGIFGMTMPVIHGESQQNALGRLLQEIVARSGDVTCIAWVGRSSEFNSTFPDHIQVYEHASRTIPHIGEQDMEKQVADLQRAMTREDEAQAMAFYQRLHTLPPAWCASQHLHLPCIVFPLTTLKKVKRDGVRVYRATTSAVEDVDINTEERLPVNPEDLVLICPWIHELLDATVSHHSCRHHPSGKGISPSDSDSDSDSEQEQDAFAREAALESRTRAVVSVSHPDLDHPLPCGTLSDQRDSGSKALKLAARFRQSEPLSALLLLAQGHGKYRRVATDHEIMIRVRNEVSLGDMILQTLDII
ncbi:hypothetical protein EV363DRAFT_1234174 [Boletus edulis]|nr:hypothetical protein EV363DRAFT_1234174 [Boletus edulis]